jgi:hypothetical protein
VNCDNEENIDYLTEKGKKINVKTILKILPAG